MHDASKPPRNKTLYYSCALILMARCFIPCLGRVSMEVPCRTVQRLQEVAASVETRHRSAWDTATYLRDVVGPEEEGDADFADLYESFAIPWYPRLTGTLKP